MSGRAGRRPPHQRSAGPCAGSSKLPDNSCRPPVAPPPGRRGEALTVGTEPTIPIAAGRAVTALSNVIGQARQRPRLARRGRPDPEACRHAEGLGLGYTASSQQELGTRKRWRRWRGGVVVEKTADGRRLISLRPPLQHLSTPLHRHSIPLHCLSTWRVGNTVQSCHAVSLRSWASRSTAPSRRRRLTVITRRRPYRQRPRGAGRAAGTCGDAG